MMELAINTPTADSRIGSHKAERVTMRSLRKRLNENEYPRRHAQCFPVAKPECGFSCVESCPPNVPNAKKANSRNRKQATADGKDGTAVRRQSIRDLLLRTWICPIRLGLPAALPSVGRCAGTWNKTSVHESQNS